MTRNPGSNSTTRPQKPQIAPDSTISPSGIPEMGEILEPAGANPGALMALVLICAGIIAALASCGVLDVTAPGREVSE